MIKKFLLTAIACIVIVSCSTKTETEKSVTPKEETKKVSEYNKEDFVFSFSVATKDWIVILDNSDDYVYKEWETKFPEEVKGRILALQPWESYFTEVSSDFVFSDFKNEIKIDTLYKDKEWEVIVERDKFPEAKIWDLVEDKKLSISKLLVWEIDEENKKIKLYKRTENNPLIGMADYKVWDKFKVEETGFNYEIKEIKDHMVTAVSSFNPYVWEKVIIEYKRK